MKIDLSHIKNGLELEIQGEENTLFADDDEPFFNFSALFINNTLGYQFDKNNFYLNTLHEPNDWEALGKFIIVDQDTMVANYVSDAPGPVIYKRLINKN